MKILLVISLAFNLLIIGAVSSKVFMPHHPFGSASHHKYKGFNKHQSKLARPGALFRANRYLLHQLPRARRKELIQLVRKHRDSMQDELLTLAAARLAFARHIDSQPENQAEFDKTYTQVKQAEVALHAKASAMTKAFISALTPAERKIYAEILQNPPHRRWFSRHK